MEDHTQGNPAGWNVSDCPAFITFGCRNHHRVFLLGQELLFSVPNKILPGSDSFTPPFSVVHEDISQFMIYWKKL